MAKRKIYQVSFYFDLHAVTSPGVWLCPKGKVAVRVSLFGVSETTKLLPPVFPLLFHERFHFQKLFRKAGSLPILETRLARLPICLQLLQYPEGTTAVVKLAIFKACLGDLLFPTAGADCNLMFCKTKCYPGIIAPIAEASTRLSLVECDIEDGTTSTLPITIQSKRVREQSKDRPIRQKTVCHTKHNLYCGCFANGIQIDRTKKKKNLQTNRRRKCDEWGRKGTVIPTTIVRPNSAAHRMSHKNHGDDFYEENIRNVKSDSSIEPVSIHKYTKDIPSELDCPSSGENPRDISSWQQNGYRPMQYETKSVPIEDYDKTYHISPRDKKERKTSHYQSRYEEDDANTDNPEYRRDRWNSFSSRSHHESKATTYTGNHQERQSKYNPEVINELKRELQQLLDEQFPSSNTPKSHLADKNGVAICCLCCPKERMVQTNYTTYDGRPGSRRNKEPSPSCSDCFLAACHQVHEATQNPSKVSLKEDIQKRPLFYSNLYAAYEKLSNKKNKKTVWR